MDTIANGSAPYPIAWRQNLGTGTADTAVTCVGNQEWNSDVPLAYLGSLSYLEAFDPLPCYWLDQYVRGVAGSGRVMVSLFPVIRRK
jgi:hypothetical protein